jgi:hypothetical protein
MGDNIRIFDLAGVPLADIRATVTRTWLLGRVGKAKFSLAFTDPNYNKPEVLNEGNYILVQNDKLPPWVGIIDLPFRWGFFQIEVSAVSAEQILGYRRGVDKMRLTGSAGAIFGKVVQLINDTQKTIVTQGDLYTDSNSREETLTHSDLLSQVKGLAKRSDNDFTFTPLVNANGTLTIRANWYKKAGTPVDFVLEEGRHLEQSRNGVTKQGVIMNDILTIGAGATSADRTTAIVKDQISIDAHGLRQGNKSFPDVSVPATLTDNGNAELKASKQGRFTFELNAVDFGETWNILRVGNTLGVRLWSVAFGIFTTCRILGMTYDPDNGFVNLVTDEVI